jgi:PAS domain S-box-containing protein
MNTAANLTTYKVLLIDANQDDAACIRDCLSAASQFACDLVHIETLDRALTQLTTALPDIILLADEQLDGLAALREAGHEVPVVVLVSQADEAVGQEAMQQGAQDYLMYADITCLLLERTVCHVIEQHALTAKLQHSVSQLHESQRQISAMLNNLPGLAYRCRNDPQWTMEFLSEGCFALTGYPPEALLMNHRLAFADLIHPDDRNMVWATVQDALDRRADFQIMYRLHTATGQQKWVTEQGCGVWNADDELEALEGLVVDITEHHRTEQALTKRAKQIDVLYRASQQLSSLLDLDVLFATVHNVIGELMDCDWLMISEYDAKLQHITCAYAYAEGKAVDVSELPPLPLAPEGKGTQSKVIRSGQPLYFPDYLHALQDAQTVYSVDDTGELVEGKDPEEGLHPRSVLLLPLKYQGQVTGVIQVKSFRGDAYSEEDMRALEALTGQIATALSNAHLFQQAQNELAERKQAEQALAKERNLLRTLIDNLPDMIYVKDTQGRFVVCNPAVAQLMGGDAPEDLIGKTDYDFFDRERADFFAEGERQVFEHQQPVLARREMVVNPVGNRRWLLSTKVPLYDADGDLMGLVGIGRDITELQQALEAEHDQRTLVEALRDTAAALTSTLEPNAVMTRILDNVGRVVPHDAANIMLIEEDTARVVHWHNYPHEMGEVELNIYETPNLRQMLETGEPCLIRDFRQDEHWVAVSQVAWVRSFISVPIRLRDTIIGFLNLDSAQPGFFDETLVDRLEAFGHEAAIALENARLFEALERQARDLERLIRERTAELQASQARYQAIVEDQLELVIRFAPDRRVTFANDATCRFTGRSCASLLGEDVLQLVHPADHDMTREFFASLGPEHPIDTIEHRMIDAQGQTCWYRWNARVILDDDTVSELQGVGRDITARKQMEEQLRRALEREIEIGMMRSRFLSMAAHDLRNPLAVIQTAVDLILKYGDRLSEEKKHERLQRIRISVRTMVELLDDILTVGRVESGRLQYDPEPLDVAEFCRQLVDEFDAVTTDRTRIQLTCRNPCGTHYLDQRLLRHILSNLLSNAIKYSPDDSPITCEVDCTPDDIVLTVADQGIGIPEAEQKDMFKFFRRFSNVGQTPGTGLGLAIVRQAVELHGGTIEFESEEGVGSTFTVRLPIVSNDDIEDDVE